MGYPADYYNAQIAKLTIEIKKINRHINILATLRLLFAILFCLIVYRLIYDRALYLWIVLFIDLSAFIFSVVRSSVLKENKLFKEQLLKINHNESAALQHDFSAFDGGKEFTDAKHAYSYDLDIFGEASLFQMINRCGTFIGREKLAKHITANNINTDSIKETQQVVAQLTDKIEWRQHFQATGILSSVETADIPKIEEWLETEERLSRNPFYGIIIYALPAVTCFAWLLYLLNMAQAGFAIALSLLQLAISLLNAKYINGRQQLISSRIFILKKIYTLIELTEIEPVIVSRKNVKTAPSKTETFKKLIKSANALDNRLNFLLAVILNALFLWDIRCMLRIEKYAKDFRGVFPEWINIIGETDVLASLACFQYNNPEYSIPEIIDSDNFSVRAKQIGHPLIEKNKTVKNDFIHEDPLDIFIVTGANMSGKSTFLRTIGIGIILANAGACVCADHFAYTPVPVFTGMRINDSLNNQTSYFYAELSRLKKIVEEAEKNRKVYLLLDEILKGTNYKDQHAGSVRLIERLLQLNAKGMIATHDIDLTQLSEAHPGEIENIAFEIGIENEKMIFDYHYKPGIVATMNATLLMAQMGIC